MLTQRDKYKEEAVKEKVEVVLAKIRPALQADGGDVELVEVNQGGWLS